MTTAALATPYEARTAPATAAERRTAALSFGDIESAVYEALAAAYGTGTDGWFDCWIVDLGTDWVVFQSYEDPPGVGMWQLGYSLDAGTVTLGADPVKVTTVTSFVAVDPPAAETKTSGRARQTRAATKDCATCDGAGTILDGNRECPDCDGTGQVPVAAEVASKAARKPRHRRDLPIMPEFRRYQIGPRSIEVRSVATADGTTVVELNGIAIAYDTAYTVTDMFGDFDETMHAGVNSQGQAAGDDVRFLINHDGLPLARTTSGTLTLSDSPAGLPIAARLDNRQTIANDLLIAIERGDITQMSVGFEVLADQWSDDFMTRDIYQIRLFDVSAVTYPASPTTSIELAQHSLRGPVESRARIRKMWQVGKEIREGKTLSQANSDLLMSGLEALHSVDDVNLPDIVEGLEAVDSALDEGQKAIAAVLGVDDPDGDPADLDPALVAPTPAATDNSAAAFSRALALDIELLALRRPRRH